MITRSFEETQKLGEQFARTHLSKDPSMGPQTIVLYGDLGSGKTTFVAGIAKGLGIKRRIISPTFIVVRQYETRNKKQEVKGFYHVDLYRVGSERDLESLGIEEIINASKNVVVVEWGEKLGELLPKKRWDVKFRHVDENKREITIQKTQTVSESDSQRV